MKRSSSLAFLLILFAGCGTSPPPRFYVLSSLEPQQVEPESQRDLVVRVAPVSIPGYLSATEIVTRGTETKLELASFDLWAEPLGEGFTRALRTNLSLLIPTERVVRESWETGGQADHHLLVSVDRFDVDSAGSARLEARWILTGPDYEASNEVRYSRIARPVEGEKHDDIVAALSVTVADFAREIAQALRQAGED